MMKASILSCIALLCFTSLYAQISTLKIGYEEFPTSITSSATDINGNVYYSGYFKAELTVNKQVLANGAGQEDLFLVKTRSTGEVVFAKTFGSPASESSTSLVSSGDHIYLSADINETTNFDGHDVVPYPGNGKAKVIARFDTTGNLQWTIRTTSQVYLMTAYEDILYLVASANGSFLFNDSAINLPGGQSSYFIMALKEDGTLQSSRVISTNPLNNLFFFDHFSNGRLCLGFNIYAQHDFNFGAETISLPDTLDNYNFFVTMDTVLEDVNYQRVNPPEVALPGFYPTEAPVCISDDDKLYFMVNSGAAIPIVYQGEDIDALNNYQLVSFDSTLKLLDHVKLADRYLDMNHTSWLRLNTINIADGQLIVAGQIKGLNEIPVTQISPDTRSVSLLPGINVNFDINGSSKFFIAQSDLAMTQGSYVWYGDNSRFQSSYFTYQLHNLTKGKIVYAHAGATKWNPRIYDLKSNTLSGIMETTADGPDQATQVESFSDGSRFVITLARGKTALDSSNNDIIAFKIKVIFCFPVLHLVGRFFGIKGFFQR